MAGAAPDSPTAGFAGSGSAAAGRVPAAALTRDPDPAALVQAVLGCPGVVRMHGGIAGEAASYLPGSRVVGVQLTQDRIRVHVVLRWPVTVGEVAGQIQAAVGPVASGRPVDVVVGDVLLPGERQPDGVTAGGGRPPGSMIVLPQ